MASGRGLEDFEWLGEGPHETYIDRRASGQSGSIAVPSASNTFLTFFLRNMAITLGSNGSLAGIQRPKRAFMPLDSLRRVRVDTRRNSCYPPSTRMNCRPRLPFMCALTLCSAVSEAQAAAPIPCRNIKSGTARLTSLMTC